MAGESAHSTVTKPAVTKQPGAIRTGLIGFGLAGSAFHAPLIAAEPRLDLVAIASSRPDRVQSRFPQMEVFADAQRLIDDPGIALVVIAAPNALHAPLAHAALTAGKHVVSDKPFVADVVDGRRLIRLAADRGLLVTVFHNRRWDGDFLTVERIVRDGTLGDIRLATLCWDRFRPAIKAGWREEPGNASGLLADLGPHLIDQALRLFGPPEAVTGDLAAQRSDAQTDDYFDLTLHYGAARVLVSASTLVVAPRPRFALHGTRGSFVKYGIDPQEAVLRAGGDPGDAGYGKEEPSAWGLLTLPNAPAEPVPTAQGDWRRFYAGVADAIIDGAPPPVDPADALAGLQIIALARQSVDEARTLRLPG